MHVVTDARYAQHITHVGLSIAGVGPTRIVRECAAFVHLRRRSDVGLVTCGSWYPEGLLALTAGVRPLVVLAHGSELLPTRSAWRRGVWSMLRRSVCEGADLVVANSEYTRRLVIRSAPRAKVAAVPLGVDHKRFTPVGRERAREKFVLPGKLLISSVSRLRAYKGHIAVFQALAALPLRVRERFVYLVAGEGPDEQALRARAEKLGVAPSVRWLGFLREDELPDLYRASDLFVLCTRETTERQDVEGFGLVFLEAQACGTPVVGTRTGGIPDAVKEGDGGWLIAQDDVAALGGILAALADDPLPFRAAGRAARERVERECTWDHYMGRFLAALAAQGIRIA